MSKKLTPWFPEDVEPVREGVYEKDYGSGPPEFQTWLDGRWWYGSNTPQKTWCKVLRVPDERDQCRPLPRMWRGLANKPAREA
jgi:hypothetical protein